MQFTKIIILAARIISKVQAASNDSTTYPNTTTTSSSVLPSANEPPNNATILSNNASSSEVVINGVFCNNLISSSKAWGLPDFKASLDCHDSGYFPNSADIVGLIEKFFSECTRLEFATEADAPVVDADDDYKRVLEKEDEFNPIGGAQMQRIMDIIHNLPEDVY